MSDIENPSITGYFIRVERDGKWQSMDIAMCTKEELQAWAEGKSAVELLNWLCVLIKWLQERIEPQGEIHDRSDD